MIALRSLAFLCLSLLAGGCSSSAIVSRAVEQRGDLEPGESLRIETTNGTVSLTVEEARRGIEIVARIVCGGRNMEEAEARWKDARVIIEAAAPGERFVRVEFPKPYRSGDGASFTILAGPSTSTAIRSTNGDVIVHGGSGPLDGTTSNGSIEISGRAGICRLSSSNGGVNIDGLDGDVEVRTSNGRMRIRGVRGSVRAESSNGGIHFIAAEEGGPFSLESSNGSARVELPAQFVGEIRASTSNGEIHVSDPGSRFNVVSIQDERGTLRAGQGGSSSVVETSNGSVTVVVGPATGR